MGSGGSKAKPIPPTAEELALQRAQVIALSNQDSEINARKSRIIKGQLGGRAALLKSGLKGKLDAGAGADDARVKTPSRPSRPSSY